MKHLKPMSHARHSICVLIHSGISHVGPTRGRQTRICVNQYQPLNVKQFVAIAQSHPESGKLARTSHSQVSKATGITISFQSVTPDRDPQTSSNDKQTADSKQAITNRSADAGFLAPDWASFTDLGHGLPCRGSARALHKSPAARPNSHRLWQMSISPLVSANMCQITHPFLLQMSGTCTNF